MKIPFKEESRMQHNVFVGQGYIRKSECGCELALPSIDFVLPFHGGFGEVSLCFRYSNERNMARSWKGRMLKTLLNVETKI